MKIKKKYNLKNVEYSFIITDILMYCLYCCQEPKDKYAAISIYNLWRNLYHYDYSYKAVKYQNLRNVVISLFPLHKNNRKRSKRIRVNYLLIDYWCKNFNINYKFHTEIFSTFKSLGNEK